MAKIPHSPAEIFDEFSRDVINVFGGDLIAIILYGSGARNEYIYKKSDINFLVVLTEDGILYLSKSFELVKKWQPRNVAVPLFLTKEYIHSSLDSFPIEFLNMKNHYNVVFGEDVLADVQIPHESLRLQCEAQVKGKLLHLRENFIQTLGQKNALQNLLTLTLTTFTSIFNAMLVLRNVSVPKNKMVIMSTTAQVFDLDKQIFDQVIKVARKEIKMSADGLIRLTQQYVNEINKLATIVDQM
ncbi:hypothetical protein JW935_18535 [candidate division KSB1 bacterium]|nr:hypothetical protein [candidate division KSB1 bacterium]